MEKNLFSFKHVASVSDVGNSVTVRLCRFQSNRPCYHDGHCGIFCCSTGNVECCFLHLRPLARFQRRKFMSEVDF